MIHRRSLRFMPVGLAWGLLAGGAAADDTEIFTQVLPPVDPNILFVIDTSGSMDSQVVIGSDYDPTVVYAGNCQADHVYYAHITGGIVTVPSCAAGEPDSFVNAASFRCQAALAAFDEVGFFLDRFAQWDDVNDDWTLLIPAFAGNPPGRERLVECRSDFGVHGDGVDPTKIYPADGPQGPWSADRTLGIDWPLLDNYQFFTANYLNWIDSNPEPVVQSRLQVVKNVVGDLLTGVSGANVGLMRFSRNAQGGMVIYQVEDIETARNGLTATLDRQSAGGSTPAAETVYEAQQYLAGRPVDFGLTSTGNDNVATPSVAASRNGDTYISPIQNQCQRSFVVLLSDGLPVDDTDADARIEALPGFSEATGTVECTDSCLDEITKYMAETDLSPIVGNQTALTYTIGFGTDLDLLAQAATAKKPDGTPGYYQASDMNGLVNAFSEILEDIDSQASTFTSPAVSVNSYNRVTSRDEVYFTLFAPSGAPHWAGNVKKYRLGSTEAGGAIQVLDAEGNPAIDSSTGTFLNSARSEWSNEVDGADPLAGGVRGRMTAERTIFTDTAGAGRNVVLTAAINSFHEDNEDLTAAMLGVPEEERADTIRFLRGVDANGDAQPILGESLHSVPILISYGGPENDPDLTLYFATNDGYLHAVDATPAGDAENLEQFAFIPNALLPRLKDLLDNVASNPVHKAYGLDGPLTYWIQGDDGDNVVEAANGEHLFVYLGMRRGGRNYYAFDLTDRSDPRLAWTIEGGSGDFTELSQTWSAATIAQLRIGGATRTVLVFGGGYDPRQDAAGPPLEDATGRAVYIVDARTGERLWWAGHADALDADLRFLDMKNSIPSDVRVIDTNADGFADRMYVGDMGARVWRFDIDNEANEVDDLAITGAVFASVGTQDDAGNRRFYYPPSVARTIDDRAGSFLTVSLGSGHRENPLGTGVADRFYVFRDANVFGPARDVSGKPVYPAPIGEGMLLDITDDPTPELDLLNARAGWRLRLVTSGEKVLAPALTADNKIFFTTYLPTVVQQPSCDLAGVIGSGRLYSVELLTGAPVIYQDEISTDDRYVELSRGGIPPAPVPVFTTPECQGEDCGGDDGGGDDGGGGQGGESGSCSNPFSQVTLLIATESHDPRICNAPRRTYWRQAGGAQ
jgi:type IV pilus assembly protein PilY1